MTSEIAKYLPAMIGVPSGITQTIKAWPFKPYINLGGQTSAAAVITYSQVDDLVTVTHTAHGFNADFNGSSIFLSSGTGGLLTAWFTDFTYIDADTYTCVSDDPQTTSGNLGTNTAETVAPFSYIVPAELLMEGVSIQLVYARKYPSLGTKTLKTYINGASDSISLTTGGATLWGNSNSANLVFVADNMYFVNGVSATLQTLLASTYTFSLQCSLATTWIAVSPSYIAYTNRG